jgi:hypothetical protein
MALWYILPIAVIFLVSEKTYTDHRSPLCMFALLSVNPMNSIELGLPSFSKRVNVDRLQELISWVDQKIQLCPGHPLQGGLLVSTRYYTAYCPLGVQ